MNEAVLEGLRSGYLPELSQGRRLRDERWGMQSHGDPLAPERCVMGLNPGHSLLGVSRRRRHDLGGRASEHTSHTSASASRRLSVIRIVFAAGHGLGPLSAAKTMRMTDILREAEA